MNLSAQGNLEGWITGFCICDNAGTPDDVPGRYSNGRNPGYQEYISRGGRQYGKRPKAAARAIERLGKSMLGEHEPGAEKEISWGDGTISFTGRDGALSGVLLRISQILQRNRARIVPRYYLIRDMCLIK